MPRISFKPLTKTFTLENIGGNLFGQTKYYTLQSGIQPTNIGVEIELVEIKINSPQKSAYNELKKRIEKYIGSYVNGEKTFQNATTSFKKIELADRLYKIITENENTSLLNFSEEKKYEFIQIFKEAFQLDSICIGVDSYPAGRLGKIIVDYRCEIDGDFKQEYDSNLDLPRHPIPFLF